MRLRVIRQFVLIVTLMFWQGGFMFYGGVVVPVGSQTLGSDTEQGFITQSVTNYLNLAGVVCLIVWAEHLWHERKFGASHVEWALLIGNGVALGVLATIHLRMDRLLDSESKLIVEPPQFYQFHRLYLGVSSWQWLTSLVLLFLTIRRWTSATQARSR